MMSWRNIPDFFGEAFSFGPVFLSWYAVCFFLGTVVSLLFLKKTLNWKKETMLETGIFIDLSLFLVFGAIIGARLGYALFYNFSFFLDNPLALISPIDTETGAWIGISGMSYHGGAIGVLIALFFFVRTRKKNFWLFADAIALAAPIAIFFGRMGNFFSGELFGRATNMPVGMIFPDGGIYSRHPSQLYEAFGEGIFLFFILLFLRKRLPLGLIFVLFAGLYGVIRFFLEFFREPDPQIGLFFGWISLGQVFSIIMITLSIFVGIWLRFKKGGILKRIE